ncbi:MAG: YraN family protein [Verrucomicrobiales bacterium]|nr:YraN family protein [Verrucomicrobiales bacterium]
MLPFGSAPARPAAPRKNERGQRGERAAARFLRKSGYRILVANYRGWRGEIDLVCRHQDTLVFVEVKARGLNAWASPAAAVTAAKQRRIIRTAYEYLDELPSQDMPVRFDVVEVYLGADGEAKSCQLIPSAFELTARNTFDR